MTLTMYPNRRRPHLLLLSLCLILSCTSSQQDACSSCPQNSGATYESEQSAVLAQDGGGAPPSPGENHITATGPTHSASPEAVPSTVANINSPLGTNLSKIKDYIGEWAFMDAFRYSRPWISGNESDFDDRGELDLDDHGWVRSLRQGQIARTLMFSEGESPSGQYIVLFEGEGRLEYWGSASLNRGASRQGRHVIDVDSSRGSLGLNIVATDTSNPLRNIRVLMPGGVCSDDALRFCDESTPCDQGASCRDFEEVYERQIFHPIFLDRIKSYSTLRFMDWMATNESDHIRWQDRPRVEDARWSERGVPVEIMVELANRLHADPWFCPSHLANDDYIRRFATSVRDNLNRDLHVWVEHSNEVWNSIFPQSSHSRERGLAQGLSSNEFHAQLLHHSRRSVQIFAIWTEVFGSTERVVTVMGSQATNPWVSEQLLDFEGAAAHTDALAIAPYFGGYLGTPRESSKVRSMSLDALFQELQNTSIPRATKAMRQSAEVAKARDVELVSYEAGQHLAGHSGVQDDQAINDLFDAANRDPRMGALYGRYLADWRRSGGRLLVHFTNCHVSSRWGRWGSLEHLTQPDREAPKYTALQQFISSNPRWW